jgi:hypothetical protein
MFDLSRGWSHASIGKRPRAGIGNIPCAGLYVKPTAFQALVIGDKPDREVDEQRGKPNRTRQCDPPVRYNTM